MELNLIRFSWSHEVRRWTNLLLLHLVERPTGGWAVAGFFAFVILTIITFVLITALFLLSDMLISMTSSLSAFKSWIYGTIIGVMFLYPVVGKVLNLSSFYATVTNYPATGPDPLACLNEYKHERYATDPAHESKLKETLEAMGFMYSEKQIGGYIKKVAPRSPVTGRMVLKAARDHKVDARLMLAIMERDSHFGTQGKAVRTKNPGNVGNDDTGRLKPFTTWDEGVEAVAKWLDKNRKILVAQTHTEEVGP